MTEANQKILDGVVAEFDKAQFLSPNEPLTRTGIDRLVDWIGGQLVKLTSEVGNGRGSGLTMWD